MREGKIKMSRIFGYIILMLCCPAFLATGCAPFTPLSPDTNYQALYTAEPNGTILGKYAPSFLVEDDNRDFNRIGAPAVRISGSGRPDIFIDSDRPVIYAMTQDFETTSGNYTNLIYRVHFKWTPLPHFTAGKNVGLLVYITINADAEVILVTTLHTCGCFLAFVPTETLPAERWPAGWQESGQMVYGETLPGLLREDDSSKNIIIRVRGGTHRVMDINYGNDHDYQNIVRHPTAIAAMEELNRLPAGSIGHLSFFTEDGVRKGFVKGSRKPFEMLFMGLLAMDPFVGEDKALGPQEETGARMYTSLKFWDRDRSNIWIFPRFLQYWGWNF